MMAGTVLFDAKFDFHDGENGKKLLVVLGCDKGIVIVAKTTSQPYGKSINYGCQPNDRFHNFYLPVPSSYFKKNTWICLNEFYELKQSDLLNKRFSGLVNHICDLTPQITREVQDCAVSSDDITQRQCDIITNSLI